MINPSDALGWAQALLGGKLTAEEFAQRLSNDSAASIADVGDAQVDLARGERCGFPEVVYGQGKTIEALRKIFAALVASHGEAFATRISPEQHTGVAADFPTAIYNPVARTLRIPGPAKAEPPSGPGRVVIVTAGTSDAPVAEEAKETAAWTGASVHIVRDVGVAGPQRLRARLPEIVQADAVVVVAGMEGALPSVVGGYVACPVIGVPTSVGYGANFGGMSALLSMLNSCAANVVVVNIDAGFKGGYVAGMIARQAAQRRSG